jgi:hypothetical protein
MSHTWKCGCGIINENALHCIKCNRLFIQGNLKTAWIYAVISLIGGGIFFSKLFVYGYSSKLIEGSNIWFVIISIPIAIFGYVMCGKYQRIYDKEQGRKTEWI